MIRLFKPGRLIAFLLGVESFSIGFSVLKHGALNYSNQLPGGIYGLPKLLVYTLYRAFGDLGTAIVFFILTLFFFYVGVFKKNRPSN